MGTAAVIEDTLAIIKPDAVASNHIGGICDMIEKSNMIICSMRMMEMSESFAGEFYGEHKGKSFFDRQIKFMTEGPVVVMRVKGYDAIARLRKLIGATIPKERQKGTIRYQFGSNITRNAIHGSDSIESAKREIEFFGELI